jgi:ATP-dependent Clp protease ATP-binding subunit ClpC
LFERFTERARQVVVLAQEEARRLNHDHIGTEHLLLGLLREPDGIAAQALGALDVTLERVRGEVVRVVGLGDQPSPTQMPFTPDAKRVLELALRETLPLGQHYIGLEHILLGLISLNEGPTVQILRDLEVTPDAIRSETLRRIGPPGPASPETAGQAQPGWRGGSEGFHVNPGPGARRILMMAGARALQDGRTVIEPRDLLLALTRDQELGVLLAELGATEAAVVRALGRRREPEAPPQP